MGIQNENLYEYNIRAKNINDKSPKYCSETNTIYPTTNISDSPSTSELLSEEEIFQSTSSRVFHSGEENITCPINLEIIADGESITTIQHCGRVFKT